MKSSECLQLDLYTKRLKLFFNIFFDGQICLQRSDCPELKDLEDKRMRVETFFYTLTKRGIILLASQLKGFVFQILILNEIIFFKLKIINIKNNIFDL